MASYTIRSGDTLSKIAQNNNTTVDALLKANPNITNPNVIYAGATLNLPGQSGATTSTNQNQPTSGNSKGDVASAAANVQTTAPPDYSNYEYDPSSNDAYMEALAALQAAQGNVPTYAGTWDAKLEEIYNQIVNREKFSYDLNADALYQQYKDQYILKGQMAMMDTMGQAAAMTGGYGNSYAQSVGQQAYQGYLQQLNDIVPELYGMALDQYNQEGQDLYNRFSMAGSMRDDEYGEYQDALSNWWKNVNYFTDRADNEYDKGYTNWYNAQQMGVDAEERDYAKDQDAYIKQKDNYDKLVTLITTTGYTPSAEELAAAGMSSGEAAAYANYYKEQKAATTASGGSGGSSGSSKSSGSGSSSSSSKSSGSSGSGGSSKNNNSGGVVDWVKNHLTIAVNALNGSSSAKLDYSDWGVNDWESYFAQIRQTDGKAAAEAELDEFLKKGLIPQKYVAAASSGARGGKMGH